MLDASFRFLPQELTLVNYIAVTVYENTKEVPEDLNLQAKVNEVGRKVLELASMVTDFLWSSLSNLATNIFFFFFFPYVANHFVILKAE